MDLEPYPGNEHTGDVRKLCTFSDNSVDEIYCSHTLEHFSHRETVSILREWLRVLKNGATLYVAVPDFEALVKVYPKAKVGEWLQKYVMGEQDKPGFTHMAIFDEQSLRRALLEAGFSRVWRLTSLPYGVHDASGHVYVPTRERISLNMAGIK